MISLLLLSLIIVAFLGVLDSTSKVAKVQGNIADSTENLRFSMAALVRVVRMAGTGGLPIVVPDGSGSFFPLALEVVDNSETAPAESYGGKTRIPGTDVLRIRGVIVDNLHDLADSPGASTIDFTNHILKVPFSTSELEGGFASARSGGVGQTDNSKNKPILLGLLQPYDIKTSVGGVRHYNGYRLIDTIDDENAIATPVPDDNPNDDVTTVQFRTDGDSVSLNPGATYIEPAQKVVYTCGLVDDMRYFIAENGTGEPSLYRWTSSGVAEELVPNIANLQVALGCDINRDGVLQDSEWFYSKDNASGPTPDQLNALREVRVSLVARSMDPDRSWSDKAVIPENASQLSGDDLKYRYRVMTVRVGLRSHPPLEDV